MNQIGQGAAKAHTAGVVAAVVALLMWGLNRFGGLQLSGDENNVLQGALTVILSWVFVYLVPNKPPEGQP